MINPGAKFKSISTRVLCGAIELFLISSAHAQAPSKQGVSVDLLITGGTIVTMDPSRRILEDGFIAVRGDEIVAVGSGASASLRFAPKDRCARQTDSSWVHQRPHPCAHDVIARAKG